MEITMTFKNKNVNSKTIYASLFIIMLVTVSVSQTSFAVDTQTQASSIDDTCTNKIAEAMHKEAAKIDDAKAITLSLNDNEFKTRTHGYVSAFNSVYNTWSIDAQNCSVTLRNVNVSYSLNDEKGYVKNVDVALNSSTTRVEDITEYVSGAYDFDNTVWSGYEIAANAGATVPIWEAKTTYTLPAVNVPTTTNSGNCVSKPCDLAIWTGLEGVLLGTSGIKLAQAGSDGKITCTSPGNCSTNYFLWYEFYPNPAVSCGGGPPLVAPGHSITSIVTNQKKYNPGGPANKYDISLLDTTSGYGCSVTGQTFDLTSPKYADYINERAKYSGTPATLAKFSSDTMQGWYYDTSQKQISTSTGQFRKDRMVNSGTVNIIVSGISSGSFTQTYSTSYGT